MSVAAVRAVAIVEYSPFARLHAAVAVTRRNAIYLRGSAQAFLADPELTLHEYYHVLCQWNTGELSVGRYLREWLRQGLSYHRIGYELRACGFAAEHLDRYRALLAVDGPREAEPSAATAFGDGRKGDALLTGGEA